MGILSPRKRAAVFGLLAAVLYLSGCSLPTKVRGMFGGDLSFYVTVSPDANENSAVAVDAVIVYDKNVLDQLLKLSASEWFTRKKQFQSDYRNSLDVKAWEWIPSQIVTKQSVPYRAGAQKVVLFADYASEGAHRQVVDPQQQFYLVLDTLDMNVKVNQ